ncbi:MAG TPA: tyrosine-type recombinase/integrase, partial [Mycobacteriales bacterium]
IEVNPSAKLPTIAVPAGKPKPIPDDVLEAALAKADASGRLMIMLAAWAGLRRADIAAVHSDDVVGVRCRRMLGGGYGAHSGRHRFATKAYATNRDIFAVQQLLGHSKPETTMRYTQLPDDALRDAVFGIA